MVSLMTSFNLIKEAITKQKTPTNISFKRVPFSVDEEKMF